jgi:pyruvate/2-oxoglutarate dehydrogenase complex dihydrolipoamide dehydrogenase (E3) component
VAWLDNARIMELTELPHHLIVAGGGFIGCEFAQMFRRFGSDVTVVEPGDHLLEGEDEAVSCALEELASLPFGKIARAIETDETDGVIRILVDPSNERILGASIVGAESGELIHIVQALMLADAPARVLGGDRKRHPHREITGEWLRR